MLVPSLINPPRILDLDEQVSLADAIARMGRRSLLLDWGPAADRRGLSVGGHIEERLIPRLNGLAEPAVVVGYCLGGTMAIAAANHAPMAGLVTLAAPWDFDGYPPESRASLAALWAEAEPSARSLGVLPIEVLQAAFWSLDPERTVRKFARFAGVDPRSAEARRFVEMEQWANEGEPVPFPAAAELIEDLFGANRSGRGDWTVAGSAALMPGHLPMLHVSATGDRIFPPRAAPPGPESNRLAMSGGVGSPPALPRHPLFLDQALWTVNGARRCGRNAQTRELNATEILDVTTSWGGATTQAHTPRLPNSPIPK